uniref:Uncharacterized protein n=1 Tax=Megaselia scalaris TaxID=36166 RepID=T1H4D0_MEGSC
MDQTTYQFSGKFYRQCFGTSIGNPLSCFTANNFMANLAAQDVEAVFEVYKDRMVSSNPIIPRIYALYKTNKPGLRPIILKINSPSSRIAKFSSLKPPQGFYIKNSFEI